MRSCSFIKENGMQCHGYATTAGDGKMCFVHNPAYKEKHQEAVVKGGKTNHPSFKKYADKRVEIRTPADIRNLLSDTINDVRMGRINQNSKTATTIGFLSKCWIEAYNSSELSDRLEVIEEKLANPNNTYESAGQN